MCFWPLRFKVSACLSHKHIRISPFPFCYVLLRNSGTFVTHFVPRVVVTLVTTTLNMTTKEEEGGGVDVAVDVGNVTVAKLPRNKNNHMFLVIDHHTR